MLYEVITVLFGSNLTNVRDQRVGREELEGIAAILEGPRKLVIRCLTVV